MFLVTLIRVSNDHCRNMVEAMIDPMCSECIKTLFLITGGSTMGILIMQEALASSAIEHGITVEEMEERVFKHKEHGG